jgi:hypothetical protein
VFPIEEIPELPMESCISESGCKCTVESVYDSEQPAAKREDAFDRLVQLKKMLDSGLITEQEFQEKRSQILAGL